MIVTTLLACGLAACGRTADNPVRPTPASVAGAWTGTYQVTSCRGGAQACFGIKDAYAIRLELSEDGRNVTGIFSGEIPGAVRTDAMPVAGAVGASTLHVHGEQSYQPQPYIAGVKLTDWTTALDTAGSTMTGAFHLTIQFRTNNVYPDVWNVDASVTRLAR